MEQGKWIKSADSNGSANCVEVRANADGTISLRDTKDKGTGPVHTFTEAEWRAFISGANRGEFDLD
jgi:Domain of unknown function (DUF397)